MRKHLGLLTAGVTALALVLGVGPATQSAKAQFFDYDGIITVNGITGAGWSIDSGNNTGSVLLKNTAGDSITLEVTPSDGGSTFHSNASGLGTSIPIVSIQVGVSQNTALQNLAIDFTYKITITDFADEIRSISNPAMGSGDFFVSGILSGSIGRSRSVNLDDLKPYAVSPSTLYIGDVPYFASIGSGHFNAPGPDVAGSFGMHIQAVPEPGSVISMALGFLGVGGLLARNRRRNRKALAA